MVTARSSSRVLERRALFDVLSKGISRGVVFLSGSPGSGKTTLLKSWIDYAALAGRTVWISGHDLRSRAVVERLVSQLQSYQEPVVLVIDDLHEVHDNDAVAELETFVAQRRAAVRVVLSSRHDPQLRLHRMRLSGELTEICDVDLRLTLEQTAELAAASDLVLSEEHIALLHARTEGWVAGLQLAMRSLATNPEPSKFVADFFGSERTIAQYLVAEVLERQAHDVKELLLRTSMLEQVSGELADVMTGRCGSERILQSLESENAFVSALDPSRSWFRYHPLFADVLRLELRNTYPDEVPALHRTAAQWYAERGQVIEAVRHAQRARDWTFAVDLLAAHYFTLSLDSQDAAVGALLDGFPPPLQSNPELVIVRALIELNRGSLHDAAACLALAQRQAASLPDDKRARFDAASAVARLTLARLRGDYDSVLDEVGPLLSSVIDPKTRDEIVLNNDLRALALMNLGIAEKWSTRFDEGEMHLLHGLQLARRIARPYIEVGCLSYLGLHFKKWTSAVGKARCEEALAIAKSQGWGCEPVAATALVRLFGYAVREGRFDEAEPFIEHAERSLRAEADPASGLLFNIARGGYYLGRGRYDDALSAFEAAQRLRSMLSVHHAFSAIPTQHVVQTQVLMKNLAGARAALEGIPQDQLAWAEVRVARASVALAENDARAAAQALAPVLDGSVPVFNIFTTAAALLLDAQVRVELGAVAAASAQLERVLELAEGEALVPAFLIAPASLRKMLERHLQSTSHRPLLAHILDLLGGNGTALCVPAHLPEALSDSELRVLRYLATNLTAPQIGSELCLSVNTIKTHIREIYAKLGAHNRSEAVDRARRFGLLRMGLGVVAPRRRMVVV